MTEKFPYEYYQNLEKLESAIQLVKLDLLDENLLKYKNITPERKGKLKKMQQLFDEEDGISDVIFDTWSEFHGEYN
ncbi:hypothetical protein V7H27_14730 [Enterococcus faecium]|uniref:Uncharacterized protein n=1 Tax=Enterococcus faecium EnGen0180 TaxID=1157475 RepID=A0A829EZ57_ENTFC|nr:MULTISPECIES: hypothetical protein [Bacteria]EOG11915.1 hypothetical protein SM5_03056 [Enterococcus faecium EnGen0177]EOG21186.1 hypothetical protein SMG_03108 [Enterococcus faecium EnGen0180]MCU1889690.1 hypothetical protein [Enterococcus faecium]MCU1892553.1 hypothetical protein [Enterococcus faecium]MCU1937245.1 hypothetical protein [Enterococcus faecium]